jgi:hypothetical protein
MLFNDRVYKILKEIALVWLPGLGAAYFTIASIWHLPAAEQVVGTITAIDTFMGLILKASTASYNKSDLKYDGNLQIVDTEDGSQLRFGNLDRKALEKESVTLKMVTNSDTAQPVS